MNMRNLAAAVVGALLLAGCGGGGSGSGPTVSIDSIRILTGAMAPTETPAEQNARGRCQSKSA